MITEFRADAPALVARPQTPIDMTPQAQPSAVRIEPIAYASPVLRIDPDTNVAVLVVRDTASGEVKRQYPSESQIRAYSSAAATR